MKTRFAVLLVLATGLVSHAFAQGCPNTGASPTSPINVNVAPGGVTFNWSPSPASGVTGYEVKAGTTTASATTVCSTNGATSCTASLNAGAYSWLVRTKFPAIAPGHVAPAIDAVFRTDLDLKRSAGAPRVLLERLVVELGDRRRQPPAAMRVVRRDL